LLFIIILFAVEEWCALLWIFGGAGFVEFDFWGGILLGC